MRNELINNVKLAKIGIKEYFKENEFITTTEGKNLKEEDLLKTMDSFLNMLSVQNGHVNVEALQLTFDKFIQKTGLEISDDTEITLSQELSLEKRMIQQVEETKSLTLKQPKSEQNVYFLEETSMIVTENYENLLLENEIDMDSITSILKDNNIEIGIDGFSLEEKTSVIMELSLLETKDINKEVVENLIIEAAKEKKQEENISKKPLLNQYKRFLISPEKELKNMKKKQEKEKTNMQPKPKYQ